MDSRLVLTLETYTEDGWYGERRRYFYAGLDGKGFKNKTEANKFKGKFKKTIKQRLKYDKKTSIGENVVVGVLSGFTTYRYAGAGPSYSCPNIEITELLQ